MRGVICTKLWSRIRHVWVRRCCWLHSYIVWSSRPGRWRRRTGCNYVKNSRGPLDKLRDYLREIQGEVLPKSPAGRAVSYTLKNWTALNRYCDDGDLEIDNNATERSIRGIAVGRRNWTFFGSDQGGKTAAVLRSFVASCQRAGVEPFAWFKDVLSRIGSHPINRIAELLPHNWAPAQV